MKLPILFALFFVLTFQTILSQNKQFLYGFEEIPQSLLENPGGVVNFYKHISIPLLSGAYISAGASNKLLSSLLLNSDPNFNDNFKNIYAQLKSNDFISLNQKLDIINIGFKLKNDKDYLSFGFYQEVDLIAYHPNDLADLYYQGNTNTNGILDLSKTFAVNNLNVKADVIGVLHAGISRKFNEKLNIGARAKIYSGGFNLQSIHNKGILSTTVDQNNSTQHHLNNIDFTFNSSGYLGVNKDNYLKNTISNMVFGGNLGLGLDVGFTYHLKDNIIVSGSVLDLGFISYSKNVTSYKIKGDITVNGINLLEPPANQTSDFWDNISVDFKSRIAIDTLHTTYITFRPPKINMAVNYRFGKQKSNFSQTTCASIKNSDSYSTHEVGLQLYSIFRPKQPQLSSTIYYSRTFSRFLKAKITYTANVYSYSNIGLGLSSQLGRFNMYVAVDNLLSYSDINTSKKISFLFGMNLIFK